MFAGAAGGPSNASGVRPLVIAAGALHLAAGLFMAIAPRSFYDQVGTFPPFNAHYLRDLATWYVALGVGLLLAVRRPAWRLPLLVLAVVQYALHVVNHVIDIGDPESAWKGPVTVVALALVAVVLTAAARKATAVQQDEI
jgi:peptidoglycan/LPS O-acetylase OafA/YrhL